MAMFNKMFMITILRSEFHEHEWPYFDTR